MDWAASTTTGVTYQYCLRTNKVSCPPPKWVKVGASTEACTSGTWVPIAVNTVIQVPAGRLANDTTYYWQVGAGDTVEANDGLWWSFKTMKAPPTSESKVFPAIDEDITLTGTLTATSNYPASTTFIVEQGLVGLTLESNGNVSYSPPANFHGQKTFTFKVYDGHNAPAGPYTATINVNPMPDTPSLNTIPDVVVSRGDLVSTYVTATDGDVSNGDGDTLTCSLYGDHPVGAVIDARGNFSWPVPDTQIPGIYIIVVKVTDSTSRSDTTSMTITVNSIPGIITEFAVNFPLISR